MTDIADGLYLVIGSRAGAGRSADLPQPMLVNVPFSKTDGTLDYEIVTEPKYEVRTPETQTVTRRALKIWKDEGNEEKRPQDITVQLLCDGKIMTNRC